VPAEDAHGQHTVEADLPQSREDLAPGDLALPDGVVLVDGDVGAGRVDDVPVAVVDPVVEAVGDVHLPQLAGRRGAADHAPGVARAVGQVEGVRAAVLVSQPVLVHGAHELQGAVVQLDEIVGVGLHGQADAVPLEVRSQLLDRPVPLLLGAAGAIAVAGELRDDIAHVEGIGQLEQAPPVAHLGHPLGLVRGGPVEHRVEGTHLDPAVLLRLPEVLDEGAVRLGVVVPQVELVVGRQLHVPEAEFGRLAQGVRCRHGHVVHIGVEGDIDHGVSSQDADVLVGGVSSASRSGAHLPLRARPDPAPACTWG